MRVAVLTSDSHAWLLRGFYRQWCRYRGGPDEIEADPLELEVVGFTRPQNLPEELPFFSVGSFSDYPVSKWSDALIAYLRRCPEELVVILLEDYWLIRPINRRAILDAYSYTLQHPDILRFDLSTDRMFSRRAEYVEPFKTIDVCSAKGDYSLSFQASIFRRDLLLEVLRPGESPWQAELNGTERLNRMPYQVVGSYQWPINYLIVMNKGRVDTTGSWMMPARTICPEDWRDLISQGCLIPGA